MKLLLNPITARKITNFQNTVRRVKIILPSLLFLLIIRASIRRPYGKNLADPRYDQKDDQFAKYCHTPLNLRFHLVFWCFSSNRHFRTLTLKFLLNPIMKETITYCKTLSNASESSFSGSLLQMIIRATFWSSYYKIRAESHSGLKCGQFAKHSHRPFIQCFPLVYLCVSCKQHFVVLTGKFLLNQITTHGHFGKYSHTPLNHRCLLLL